MSARLRSLSPEDLELLTDVYKRQLLSRANIELADDISEKVIHEIASYASYTSQITPVLNLSDLSLIHI